jgi:hypothetical protein
MKFYRRSILKTMVRNAKRAIYPKAGEPANKGWK